MFRRVWLIAALALALASPATLPEPAAFGKTTKVAPQKSSKKKTSKKKKSRARLVCKGKGKARKCKRIKGPLVTSRKVPASELRAAPLGRPSGRIHLYVPSLDKELKVNIYNPDGSYNQAVLAQLDEMWMCRRTKEVRAVDPRLYEVLSTIYDHYGKRIELLSGFRFQRNEGSRHFHASAMDIRVPGVSYKELFRYAETLDPGGMGIGEYPNLNFVHIDFRAPGELSTRWTDRAGSINRSDSGKLPSRSWRGKKKPNT